MTLVVVTEAQQLLRMRAAEPGRVIEQKRLLGLAPGEKIAGIDFRVARATLYALATSGRLYTIDTSSGIASPVGKSPAVLAFDGTAFGVDFNPVSDRIRVVSNSGQNQRIHPDTGATIDGDVHREGLQGDTPLAFAPGDVQAGRTPDVAALAYTPAHADPQITRLYGIDCAGGLLVRFGAAAANGQAVPQPKASSGQLFTVGALGTGPVTDASMDIADADGTALAALRSPAQPLTTLYRIDLASGRASAIGLLGDGSPVVGMAIEP